MKARQGTGSTEEQQNEQYKSTNTNVALFMRSTNMVSFKKKKKITYYLVEFEKKDPKETFE